MIKQEVIDSLKEPPEINLTEEEKEKLKKLRLTPYESAVLEAKLKIKDIWRVYNELSKVFFDVKGGVYSIDFQIHQEYQKAIEETRHRMILLAQAELKALENFKTGYTIKNKKN
jgi:hypothetical protein